MTDTREGSVVASTLMMLACLVLGVLAGGMLVIGIAFVSFWKSLSPSDFQVWFASYSHLIGRLMIPLGVGGVGHGSGRCRVLAEPRDVPSVAPHRSVFGGGRDGHVPALFRGD